MRAISATGQIDAQGQLCLDIPLEVTKPASVQVIILLSDAENSNIGEAQQRDLMSEESFSQEFKQALIEAGYDSREKIINLVQEVKQE